MVFIDFHVPFNTAKRCSASGECRHTLTPNSRNSWLFRLLNSPPWFTVKMLINLLARAAMKLGLNVVKMHCSSKPLKYFYNLYSGRFLPLFISMQLKRMIITYLFFFTWHFEKMSSRSESEACVEITSMIKFNAGVYNWIYPSISIRWDVKLALIPPKTIWNYIRCAI